MWRGDGGCAVHLSLRGGRGGRYGRVTSRLCGAPVIAAPEARAISHLSQHQFAAQSPWRRRRLPLLIAESGRGAPK